MLDQLLEAFVICVLLGVSGNAVFERYVSFDAKQVRRCRRIRQERILRQNAYEDAVERAAVIKEMQTLCLTLEP